MSVKPETLETPERDMEVTTRGTKRVPDGELQSLRQRIAAAKLTVGKDLRPHCSDCFRRGWAAAVREIAGE